MKRPRYNPHTRVLKAACTVSAAALMLGVSHAATVGLNFQVDWTENNSPGYTGVPVTATAFGIPPGGWQNLAPLPTGYNGSGNAPGPFTTNEVISATSTNDGLHPLPNGSLNLVWSCVAANTSGYAGNDPAYGGNHPNIGEQEVYYGFMRDDVFIYTHPESTNGYSVAISGLSSVFTNSQYVIQLVAATDSGNAFTNAILTSGASTQLLSYTATRTGKGIMGGLSSVSTPLTNDSITIAGAPALSDDATSTYLASTIAGIIITDKPLIETQPQSPVAPFCDGTNVTLSVVAIGVPPLKYQWRNNGAPIPGATASTYAVADVSLANSGYYDVVVTNQYGTAISSAAAVTGNLLITTQKNLIVDSQPLGTKHDGNNNGAAWLASSADGNGTNRLGLMQFSAPAPSQITLPGETNFDTSLGTILFWMRSSGTYTNLGNQGAALFDRNTGSGLLIVQADDGTLLVQPSGSGNKFSSASTTLSDNNWHMIAIAYDQSDSGSADLYIDGVLDTSNPNGAAWSWPVGQQIALGLSHDAYWRPYNGMMDDFRIYNRVLTAEEISSVYTGGALVDTTALQVQFNFDGAPSSGLTLDWTCGSLQSADVVNGPYTDVPSTSSPWSITPGTGQKFYRLKR